MRILLLIDKPNWAYHSIAKSLIKFNTNTSINMDIMSVKGKSKEIEKIYKKYDRFYVMGFQLYEKVPFLPKKRTLVGIHSCHSWDNKKTSPTNIVYPDNKLIKYLSGFFAVNAVSKYLYDIFSKRGLKNLSYTPNGVDSKIFFPNRTRKDTNFFVGYSGTKTHDWRKGISDYIIPAAIKSSVKISLAMRSTGSQISLENMPSFYNALDTYVCASVSEGFSLSVLEAASCGVPIISTKITGCTELIKDGKNGFFVDRNVKDISDKIDMLKDIELRKTMSHNIRNDVVKYHCWSKKVNKWINFLRGENGKT